MKRYYKETYEKADSDNCAELDAKDAENAEIMNILLMGKTGIGKSTFINAFGNYLKYDTLKQATKNKVNINKTFY